jgi:aminopeptidase N
MKPLLALPLACAVAAACETVTRHELAGASRPIPMDIHSHAEPNDVRVRHMSLNLALDFDAQRAEGSVRLDLERLDPTAPLILDANELEIQAVAGSDGGERSFELGPKDEKIASALTVHLAPSDKSVTIRYRTSPSAEAMQWLAPEQTAGGKRPFLFTQGQSILTRSWIPCQDSPGVRVTFDAKIRAPEGLTAVMSAEQLGRDKQGAFRFRMSTPIPPYLIALACGELQFREISSRCGVWAEPPVVDRARAELGDTEAMIASAEELFGPYRWGRYDLIVLPPSFPFGGMENPRLTFATPTILAGDKSLVGLVAHELAHSWSGNLVTNATWSDFWLNEGFTVYFEQRIMEQVYGVERSEMEKLLGVQGLEKEMAELKAWQQVLHVDLAGKHPDEAFSQVPYEKGALFLRRVEELVGRKAFDQFLRGWFDGHAFQSVTTADFLAYLQAELLADHPAAAAQLDLRGWIHTPGLPADAPRPQSDALALVDAELARWKAGAPPTALDTKAWVTHQWLRFLEGLPESIPDAQMTALDRAFRFTDSGNSEILCAWLVSAIRNRYAPADRKLESFLMDVGRRKFLKPLYAEMAKTPEGLERAKAIYAKARPRYHSVSTGTIDDILKWGT